MKEKRRLEGKWSARRVGVTGEVRNATIQNLPSPEHFILVMSLPLFSTRPPRFFSLSFPYPLIYCSSFPSKSAQKLMHGYHLLVAVMAAWLSIRELSVGWMI
jgi:hypothetical protein